ncbi:uncharacterized protein (TIGR04222 family) [Kribbella amoyensis]|uniref:Uncharacterized protein (TIGR04222 family) n=2 Tax=Kribbella amoyensis TaxID=996641 RepID=A0A561BP81_9ACTN|nr:uncharacterized protein (TIGR04222 family) [Kribbella amoyensis]
MLTENPLDLSQLAYLCGGPRRAALTTLLTLIQHRAIAISPARRVTVLSPTASNELERAVLDAVPATGLDLDAVVDAIVRTPAMTELRASLIQRGLVNRWRLLTLRGRRMRRKVRDTERSGLPRVAVVGAEAIAEARIRQLFSGPTTEPTSDPSARPAMHPAADLRNAG